MKGLSRVKLSVIHGIGITVVLIVALIMFFAVIKPKREQVQTINKEAESTEGAGGTLDGVKKKAKELVKAKKDAADTVAKYAIVEKAYMPDLGLDKGDLIPAYENSLIKMPEKWGKWITNWYEAQRNLGIARLPGVEFPVAAFGSEPNAIAGLAYLKIPQGAPWHVALEAKDFDSALAHLNRFNRMTGHGMPVVTNVQFTGQSPNLTLSYDLALYVIPKAPPLPADPRIGAAGAKPGGMSGQQMGMMGGGPQMGGMGGSGAMNSARGGAPAGAATSGGKNDKGASSSDP